VFDLAAAGDVVAQSVTEEACTYLGIALANIVHIINPGMIILGGQVAQVGNLLIQPLQELLHDLGLSTATQSLRVVQGRLGSDANSVGAITLALQDI
jgi:glucokinase